MGNLKRNIGRVLNQLGFKKGILKIYFFFFNHKERLTTSYRKKSIPARIRRRSKDNIYAIDLDSDWLGLGARIVKTIEILLYCDEQRLIPLIRFSYKEKNSHPDYFGELFSYRQADVERFEKLHFTSVRDTDELGWDQPYNLKLRLSTAKSIFDKYLEIKPEILYEVDQFVNNRFQGRKVLGVHYRGTDKSGEAPLVSVNTLLKEIQNTIEFRPDLGCIFLSTDDQAIIQEIQKAGLSLELIFRQDAIRSIDGGQFHRKMDNSKSVVNHDAIVNMLILSRCTYLVKTASILSDCSVIFNPAIEVKLLNKPHSDTLTWWPCLEIIQNQEVHEKLYS